MAAHRSRLPLAIAVAVVAATAATLLLRPRDGLIEPAAVNATAYFSAADLQRAEEFRDLQRILALAGIALSGVVVALIALRPPGPVRRAVERAGRRPLLGGAAVAAGIALVVAVVELPLALWRHERAVDFGLSTQSLGPWLGDVAKAAAVSALTAAIAGLLVLALIRRFPRHWWAPSSVGVVALAAATLYLQPIVVAPLFNDFEPLPRGELRAEVLRLADRAGVDVGEVYRVDASRRTTAINAYVGGLGDTKRVVLYDNLIEDFPRAQVRSVVAHELGHVKHRDLWHGLLWVAIVAPAGMLCVQRLAERFARGPLDGAGKPGPAALPAVALAFALVSFALSLSGNYVSRAVEAR
ncbi:MAG TPA: M48 family metalloprotease, partial [Thermoleophilaceae bacterium]|nr:M48 family metalloprotease [Thermoleophilaceae bacterium]